MGVGNQMNMGSEDRDQLLDVIQKSMAIRKHIDFFLWLQQEVRYFLPHDVLIAAWGDFARGPISYDIASSIPGIRTQTIIDGSYIDPLITGLYEKWIGYGQQGYELRNVDVFSMPGGQSLLQSSIGELASMRSVVVHGIHDRRSNDDCLFVFLDQSPAVQLDQTVLGLLLPHIDAALRRVESLQPSEPPPLPAPVISISKHVANDISFREEEIMTWVGQGKSNEEIGMILGISPNTVKNHLKKIFQKLNVSTRAQAVAKYMAYEQAA